MRLEAGRGGGRTPWHTLLGAFYGALVAGCIYAFSTYSPALQAAFQLSEADVLTLGIAMPLSGLGTFVTGLVLDRTSVPFCCALGGAVMAVTCASLRAFSAAP